MRCVFRAVIFLVLSASPLWSQSPLVASAEDTTVVPGQRVGPITLYSSLSVLQGLYGAKNVKPKMQPLPSGDTTPGARLFEGTDHQLDLLWDEEGRNKRVVEVRIIGKAWTLANGLRTGLGLQEVEKINGKAFRLNSFDWDYATFDGGALASGLGVRFFPTTAPSRRGTGSDKKTVPPAGEVRAASPIVTQIAIWLR